MILNYNVYIISSAGSDSTGVSGRQMGTDVLRRRKASALLLAVSIGLLASSENFDCLKNICLILIDLDHSFLFMSRHSP